MAETPIGQAGRVLGGASQRLPAWIVVSEQSESNHECGYQETLV